MTLADENTNSTLTDDANRAFQSNAAMQVTQPGDQILNQFVTHLELELSF